MLTLLFLGAVLLHSVTVIIQSAQAVCTADSFAAVLLLCQALFIALGRISRVLCNPLALLVYQADSEPALQLAALRSQLIPVNGLLKLFGVIQFIRIEPLMNFTGKYIKM